MKTLLFIILIISFVLVINAQYTSKPDEVQLGVPKIIQTIKRGDFTYSVQQTPIKLIKDDTDEGLYFIETVCSILVKKKNDTIQEFKLQNETDSLAISFEKNFFNKEFGALLKVKYEWNHDTTEPRSYIGYGLYTLDTSGKIITKVFTWFEVCSLEYAPSASLMKMIISNYNIIINYMYLDMAGYPDYGDGTITVTYTLNKTNKTIEFNGLDNQVYRKKRMPQKISWNDYVTASLISPELVPLDKDILNEKFKDLLKVYNFLY